MKLTVPHIVLGIAFALQMALTSCARQATYHPEGDGDAERGKQAMQRHQCNVCHVIPGTSSFQGTVGPSLKSYRHNVYVAGKFPNDEAHLVKWILDPPKLAPETAMPALGVSDQDARDMVAYLYSLD